MKKLQQVSATTAFLVLLTSTTLAGEISTPGIAQPMPTPSPTSSSARAAGEIPTGESPSDIDVSEITLLTEVALNSLQIMLSVF